MHDYNSQIVMLQKIGYCFFSFAFRQLSRFFASRLPSHNGTLRPLAFPAVPLTINDHETRKFAGLAWHTIFTPHNNHIPLQVPYPERCDERCLLAQRGQGGSGDFLSDPSVSKPHVGLATSRWINGWVKRGR